MFKTCRFASIQLQALRACKFPHTNTHTLQLCIYIFVLAHIHTHTHSQSPWQPHYMRISILSSYFLHLNCVLVVILTLLLQLYTCTIYVYTFMYKMYKMHTQFCNLGQCYDPLLLILCTCTYITAFVGVYMYVYVSIYIYVCVCVQFWLICTQYALKFVAVHTIFRRFASLLLFMSSNEVLLGNGYMYVCVLKCVLACVFSCHCGDNLDLNLLCLLISLV